MKTHAVSLLIGLTLMGCSSKFNDDDAFYVTGNADDTGTASADDDTDADADDDADDADGDADGDSPGSADTDGDGVSIDDGDCDDEDDTVSPDADEICDGIDNDCDGVVDETFDGIKETLFEDADGDGFGNPEVSEEICPDYEDDGWVEDDTDCDDNRDDVYPGADEDFSDEVDNDCDGVIDGRFDFSEVEVEDLPEDVRYGTPSSIAVDATSSAHIVFEAGGDVMYSKVSPSGSFTEAVVISDDDGGTTWSSGEYLDAEVDELGRVHVGYVSTFEYDTYLKRELHYALGAAGMGWTDEIIEGDASSDFDLGQYVDIEIFEGGITGTTATFAYLDADNGNARVADVLISGGAPFITTIGSGFPEGWTGGALDPSAMYTSLGLDSEGTHYVAWYDPNASLTLTPQIQYTQYTWDPGAVVPDDFDPFSFDFSGIDLGALIPGGISIEQTLVETRASALRLEMTHGAEDTAETPCVTFIDTDTNTLKFGCESVTGWSEITALPVSGFTPSQPDLAISQTDEFFISFYNASTRDLMLASKRKGSDWEIITVDEIGDVGQESSIDVGTDGSIHISYHDATHGTLKYARGF